MESNYEKALAMALDKAFYALQERDLEDVAFRSGSTLVESGHLRTSFLNRSVEIEPFSEQVLVDAAPAGVRTAILILHYLIKASGIPLSGRLVGFKDVPQGSLYYEPFRNRVLRPMPALLEADPAALDRCLEALGGQRVAGGDLAFRMPVFPYIRAHYILYAGEEGLPPDANILFDAAISEYLSTEDIVVMCEEINRVLKAELRKAAS